MAISRVGAGSAESTTVTIPAGHVTGDLILIFAFRDGSATPPTLPAGWTSANTTAGTTCSDRLGWKVATSSAESSGTWTNATELVCIVYRGVDQTKPVDTLPANNAGASTTVNYQPVFRNTGNNKEAAGVWIVAFAGHRSINTTLETPPTNLTLVQSQAGATAEAAAFDSNGPMTTWPDTNVSVGGTSSGWTSEVTDLFPARMQLNNYQFVKAGDGISVSEKIR